MPVLKHRRYDFFFAAIPFTDDVNQKGAASQTSFHRAIVYTSIDRETLARLLDLGFDLNSRDAEGRTILGCTVYAGSGWLCVKWILELAAEKLSDEMLNQIYDLARSTRLHWTVPQEVIAWIETHTPDRIEKIAVSEELTPSQFFDQPELIEFCHVISENDLQELDRLIKTVDVNAQGANGVTPLYWAYFAVTGRRLSYCSMPARIPIRS